MWRRPPDVHQVYPDRGFNRADEDGFRHSRRLANGVDAKMAAVNQVHVSVARFAEHHSVAVGQAWLSMARRIAHFSFDNDSAARTIRRLPNQPMPKQARCNDLR
jgi:hypothetical protein